MRTAPTNPLQPIPPEPPRSPYPPPPPRDKSEDPPFTRITDIPTAMDRRRAWIEKNGELLMKVGKRLFELDADQKGLHLVHVLTWTATEHAKVVALYQGLVSQGYDVNIEPRIWVKDFGEATTYLMNYEAQKGKSVVRATFFEEKEYSIEIKVNWDSPSVPMYRR